MEYPTPTGPHSPHLHAILWPERQRVMHGAGSLDPGREGSRTSDRHTSPINIGGPWPPEDGAIRTPKELVDERVADGVGDDVGGQSEQEVHRVGRPRRPLERRLRHRTGACLATTPYPTFPPPNDRGG